MPPNQKSWKKKGGGDGSFTSDRIPPPRRVQPTTSTAASGRTGSKSATTLNVPATLDPPPNKEVVQIEKQIKALRLSSGGTKDPKGGCFCLARDHSLSPHVPICNSCGLVLCALNLPQHACPFCGVPVLRTGERNALISRLETQVAEILEREERAKVRAEMEARQAAGAFPTLLDSMKQPQQQSQLQPQLPQRSYHHQQQSLQQQQQQQQQEEYSRGRGGSSSSAKSSTQVDTHKVLTLRTKPGSKKSQVVISSYSPSPAGSRPVSRGPEVGPEEDVKEVTSKRVPRPDREPKYSKQAVDPNRPWQNLLQKRST